MKILDSTTIKEISAAQYWEAQAEMWHSNYLEAERCVKLAYAQREQANNDANKAEKLVAKSEKDNARLRAELAAERERADTLHKAQPYLYIGKNGKAVLARDLEYQLDAALAKIKELEEEIDQYDARYQDEENKLRADLVAEREWRKIAGDERKRAIAAEDAVAKLREALEPFGRVLLLDAKDTDGLPVLVRYLRRARAVLEETGDGEVDERTVWHKVGGEDE